MITMLMHAALLAANPAVTADAQDRWLAFTGCWRAENAPATSLLCVVPSDGGARMIEIEDGVTRERRVIADGQQRPVSVEGCNGFESARWSADGERVFLKTELKCGEHAERTTSGIFSFATTTQWLSIEAVTVGDQGGARTIRYTEVAADQLPMAVRGLLPDNYLARETARYAAVKPLDFADISEAIEDVEPRAAEALVVARGQPFDLSGRRLLALADAGFPDFVIDAMVAVSHPDIFEVRSSASTTENVDSDERTVATRDRYCDAFMYSPWLSPLDRYRCDRYRSFGYSDYYGYRTFAGGYYSPWDYYNTPVIIIRDPGRSEGSGGKASRNGYRRGSSTSTEQAQPRSTSTPSASRPASTSSGSSDASSSSGSGRTAKPRDK